LYLSNTSITNHQNLEKMIIGCRGGWRRRRIGGCHDEINMDGRLNNALEA
jgi:hypothetical protein